MSFFYSFFYSRRTCNKCPLHICGPCATTDLQNRSLCRASTPVDLFLSTLEETQRNMEMNPGFSLRLGGIESESTRANVPERGCRLAIASSFHGDDKVCFCSSGPYLISPSLFLIFLFCALHHRAFMSSSQLQGTLLKTALFKHAHLLAFPRVCNMYGWGVSPEEISKGSWPCVFYNSLHSLAAEYISTNKLQDRICIAGRSKMTLVGLLGFFAHSYVH